MSSAKLRAVLCLLAPMIIIGVLSARALYAEPQGTGQQFTETGAGGKSCLILCIAHADTPNSLYINVIDRLKARGAYMKLLHHVPDPRTVDYRAIASVALDSYWIEDNLDNPLLHGFLRKIAPTGTPIYAIGGPTSKLFDALDKAGVYKLPVDEYGNVRNPAYWDPPVAGYLGKVDGPMMIIISNDPDVESIADLLGAPSKLPEDITPPPPQRPQEGG